MTSPTISHFHDVHAHAATVLQWNQAYNQLTAGSTESSLMQMATPGCHLFVEQINQRVVQHGVAPKGKMCFAVPITVPGAVRMQGREADDSSLFFLQGGEEFMFHMPKGMKLLSITFEQELFERTLAQTASPRALRQLLRQPVIRVAPQRLALARERLLGVFSQALEGEGLSGAEALAHDCALEQAMLGELLHLMTDPGCDKAQRNPSSTRSFIVEKCHRLATTEKSHAPSVVELCERLNVSRRTVQNSFQAVAETTPLNYMRCVRLNGVRRALMSTRAAQLSVGDAAGQWGFYHLSHFAAEYHELFAELPSHTPRATLASAALA
ncbi:helix-turn-helix domain-containing protein [Pseudomonas sp. KNUC1026]|uniref:helix-turn-helix domain-containing protein n=1 Tax=Pseudomonas sp. KNUC1026 TaxID=2893890 RepID=UPI001F3D5070|nr:helix-turn-helix domain-containing protein [Pseudomonas sp. KNUC1026]UFH50398.1 helix-turn-helix domain-containing protein [Pseudomonas sp. KNUC1026]